MSMHPTFIRLETALTEVRKPLWRDNFGRVWSPALIDMTTVTHCHRIDDHVIAVVTCQGESIEIMDEWSKIVAMLTDTAETL